MPKPGRQLDREIAEALSGSGSSPRKELSASSSSPRKDFRFTIHAAKKGLNRTAYAESSTAANRVARRWAKEDFLVTVLEQDPDTLEYRVVLQSNRSKGEMKIKTKDARFSPK